MRTIYSRMPADPGHSPVVVDERGIIQGCENPKSVSHGFEVPRSPPLAEFVLFPREIPENTRDVATLVKEGVPRREVSSMSKITTIRDGRKYLSWDSRRQNLGELGWDNELTVSNPSRPYDTGDGPQDTHLENIEMTSPSAWLTSGEADSISKRSFPTTPLGPRNGSPVQCYDISMRTVSTSAVANAGSQDGETGVTGSQPIEQAPSPSEKYCPTPAFRFARNYHEPGNYFRSRGASFRIPRMYPFPFPSTEDVPKSPSHDEIPPNSLVFVQDPQYADRPAGVYLGYQFPQIPRNNPILPYLHVAPPCPAAGRPPIPNLVETTQTASGSQDDMDVPRSWWHYFYCSVVPSHLFENDRQPSLNLPELDHWSIDVEPAGDTRPPSLMKETYQERQEKRLKRAICNRWIRSKLEMIRILFITGPKMAVAIILWVFRWCGLDRSHAGWYG